MTTIALALSGEIHAQVQRHLFPNDGYEAAVILLCTRTPGPRVEVARARSTAHSLRSLHPPGARCHDLARLVFRGGN